MADYRETGRIEPEDYSFALSVGVQGSDVRITCSPTTRLNKAQQDEFAHLYLHACWVAARQSEPVP